MIYCVFYKPSDMVGLVKNGFNNILNLGLSYLRVVGDFKIYTEFVTWQFSRNYHVFYLTLYIYLCILLTSLSDGVIFLHYELYQVHTIIGDSSPLSNPIKEKNKHACFT